VTEAEPAGAGSTRSPSARIRVDILTLFPGIFRSPLRESLLGRAIDSGLVDVRVHDIREHTEDKHRQADDYAFGGGPGMVLKPGPIFEAVESLGEGPKRIVLLSPSGRRLDQELVRELGRERWMVLICGRYEGVDERVLRWVDEEISLGDFILTGGEFAALAVIDAVARLVPGVLGNELSAQAESFSRDGLLEGPQYTRPPDFRGLRVPDVLLSGDHAKIAQWRREEAVARTRERRPDLLTRQKA